MLSVNVLTIINDLKICLANSYNISLDKMAADGQTFVHVALAWLALVVVVVYMQKHQSFPVYICVGVMGQMTSESTRDCT